MAFGLFHLQEKDVGKMEVPMEKRVTPPVVSVVVPIHNAEKFLKKCLDSICGQTLENIEIICIDDGCTDGSLKILSDFTSKDGRIRVFSQEASNAGHARNVGMEKASGEFLSFLDADDWFEKEMLNSMVALAKRENADIVFCKAKTYDQRTGRQSEKSFSLRERLVPRKKTFSVQESTYWQTEKGATFPHLCIVDMGKEMTVSAFEYLPRAEQGAPGSVKGIKFFVKNK